MTLSLVSCDVIGETFPLVCKWAHTQMKFVLHMA